MDQRRRRIRLERLLGAATVLTLIVAWLWGSVMSRTDLRLSLAGALPEAQSFSEARGGIYKAWRDDQLLGYAVTAEGDGYGGPLTVVLGVDPRGRILGAVVAHHRETPSFFRKAQEGGLPEALRGRSVTDPLMPGADLDAITGATRSAVAITDATRAGARMVAIRELDLRVPEEPAPSIRIGVPEVTLVFLLLVGALAHRPMLRRRRYIRWITLVTGLLVLGFVYNRPLTLASVNRLLLGYWPALHTDLYWYVLLGGGLLILLASNRNPYCEWFCPFGAAQECVGAVGGARPSPPGRYREVLKWSQRGLAWLAVITALVLRNPGVSSFEVFGGLFRFLGSPTLLILLALVLLASLFIRRPWCGYLCPLRPVVDLIRLFRNWTWEWTRAWTRQDRQKSGPAGESG